MPTTFESASDLARALRRAAEAHGQHEEHIGRPDPDWPDWYALYMERQQAGRVDQAVRAQWVERMQPEAPQASA